MTDDKLVTVTQADREAAAEFVCGGVYQSHILRAEADDAPIVQAFARRAAAERERCAQVADAEAAKLREEAAKCARWSAAQGERLRAKDTAMNIADAIRTEEQQP